MQALVKHREKHGTIPSFMTGGEDAAGSSDAAAPWGPGQPLDLGQLRPPPEQEQQPSEQEQQPSEPEQQPRWARDPRGPGRMAQPRREGKQQGFGNRAGEAAEQLEPEPMPSWSSTAPIQAAPAVRSKGALYEGNRSLWCNAVAVTMLWLESCRDRQPAHHRMPCLSACSSAPCRRTAAHVGGCQADRPEGGAAGSARRRSLQPAAAGGRRCARVPGSEAAAVAGGAGCSAAQERGCCKCPTALRR